MPIDTAPHRHPRRAVVIASGGLDSTVLAYWLAARGAELTLLSFDYSQRHRIELEYAADIARLLNSPHEIVDLAVLGRLLVGSALTDAEVSVPDGYYTDESMRAAVVPNRNAITLDIAVAVAVVCKADVVAFGAHAGDHAIYPDCRPSSSSGSPGRHAPPTRDCWSRSSRSSRRFSPGVSPTSSRSRGAGRSVRADVVVLPG